MTTYRGVKKNKIGKWVATCATAYLGCFVTPKEAAYAVDDFRMRINGEYNKLNFPDRHQPPTRKVCKKCTELKPIKGFVGKICADCYHARVKAYQVAFKQNHGANQTMVFRRRGIEQRLSFILSQIKYRSKTKQIPFSISLADVLRLWNKQAQRCAITGELMTSIAGKGEKPTAVSVDRIDSNYGYTPNNIQLCTVRANRAKQNMNMMEFIEFCKIVAAYQQT